MKKWIFVKKQTNIPWQPLNDSLIRGWFDASDTSTLFDATSGGNIVTANNGTVLRWENKVPVGTTGRISNIVGAASGTTRKYKFVTNYVNGLGCLGGTGSDKPMFRTFSKIFPFTAYAVAAVVPTNSTWRFVMNVGQATGANQAPGAIEGGTTGTTWFYMNRSQDSNNQCLAVNQTMSSSITQSSGLFLHGVRSLGGTLLQANRVSYSINGNIEAQGTRQANDPGGCPGVQSLAASAIANIGNRDDLNVSASTRICEIIVTPTTDLDVQYKYEGYLAHKWGLEGNLPSDHPYKSKPPRE